MITSLIPIYYITRNLKTLKPLTYVVMGISIAMFVSIGIIWIYLKTPIFPVFQ